MYRPLSPFDTALILLVPTFTEVQGKPQKQYPALTDGIVFNGSFKTYGGTVQSVNGVISIEDTAQIEAWFRPEIKSGCRVVVANTGATYDIVGEPENINNRNQFIKMTVKRTKGGA